MRTKMTSVRRSVGALAIGLAMIGAPSRTIAAQRGDTLAHGTLNPAAPAHLQGVVTSRENTPIQGVDVWLISIDRHVQTDSTGAFRFDSLPAGQLLFEFRRIGYDVHRDTLTLRAGDVVVRRIALTARAQRLDTVRTVAPEQKYLSPKLRGFEERRLSGQGGRFISDSVLRANENSTLANIIRSRVPGATLTPGMGGSQVLASSRKQCPGSAMKGCSGNACHVEIHVDGVLIYYPKMNEQPPDLGRMGVTDYAGVEFYADAASMPIEMHSSTDEGCGSLWLWTREK
jgi:Carboxypeptidase regulatory-like domain